MHKEEYIKLFKEIVGRNKDNYVRVKIPDDKVEKIHELVKKVVAEKSKESHHKIDGEKEYKRFYTGFLGEAAIEELYKVEIIDWSIGDSKKYNTADLKKIDLNIGVKTSEFNNFPIIFKDNYYPQIINFRYGGNVVYVCGIATVDVLNNYQRDDLVLSPNLKKRGTKTAFWGFDELISLKGIKDINEIKNIIQGD